MNAVLMIYLYGIWDSLVGMLKLISILGLIGMVFWAFILMMMRIDDSNWMKDFRFKPWVITWVFFVVFYALTPSKNILVAMMAANPVIDATKEVGTRMSDANVTDRIIKILDNSLYKLEEATESLKEK